MAGDLTIAWLLWFVMRWPILRTQVNRRGVRICRSIGRLPREIRYAFGVLKLESELARRRELRAAGLPVR